MSNHLAIAAVSAALRVVVDKAVVPKERVRLDRETVVEERRVDETVAREEIDVEGDVDPVADALTQMAECEYVVMTAGSFDLMVEIVCEDDDHLLETINKKIRALPGVRSTESFVYLKLKKQTYMWGTR